MIELTTQRKWRAKRCSDGGEHRYLQCLEACKIGGRRIMSWTGAEPIKASLFPRGAQFVYCQCW
jgi:hypothetical protein